MANIAFHQKAYDTTHYTRISLDDLSFRGDHPLCIFCNEILIIPHFGRMFSPLFVYLSVCFLAEYLRTLIFMEFKAYVDFGPEKCRLNFRSYSGNFIVFADSPVVE